MKIYTPILWIAFLLFSLSSFQASAQKVKGKVIDEMNNEPLIGASVIIEGSTGLGTVTDYDGDFELKIDAFPSNLIISYIGFSDKTIEITNEDDIVIKLAESVNTLDVVVVKTDRVSDEQKKEPLTVESLDLAAIKEVATDNFYDALGSQKGVDMTAAGLGFKVINTRGFNSTSPVRSLQIIDGVDNQAPGLNFSLGNFLGTSDLDVLSVDIVVGASSAFYGPNAFNGVISMKTKNPFYHKGVAVSMKGAERNMLEGAFRWADAKKNKDGFDYFAFKLNLFYLRADDWLKKKIW